MASIDSMPGNGNNYHLWYDTDDALFAVLAWDLNESFGGFWMASNKSRIEILTDWSNLTESNGLGQTPGGPGCPGDGEGGNAVDGRDDVTFDRNNPLVDRFPATPSFADAHEERYAELLDTPFADGAINCPIYGYSDLLGDSNADRGFVSDRVLAGAMANKQQWVAERLLFLESLGIG